MRVSRVLVIIGGISVAWMASAVLGVENWSPKERSLVLELQLQSIPPQDPTNSVADNKKAAELGQKLFFDKRLSESEEVACSTCHAPDKFFADNKRLSEGVGMTNRNAPTVVGSSWNTSQFWDGRADSQWAQALGPIENPAEHGFTRGEVAQVIDKYYRETYEAVFGPLPAIEDSFRFPEKASPVGDENAIASWQQMTQTDQILVNRIFANVGKAIAAYERLLKPGISKTDTFLSTMRDNRNTTNLLNESELAGLRLFVGKANCVSCHSGSQFSDNRFHNTGVPISQDLPIDFGRSKVLEKNLTLEFGCQSSYSDNRSVCQAIDASDRAQNRMLRAYKTPSLRGVANTAPYMHAGQFKTLRAVLEHYNRAPKAPMGTSEVLALQLSESELDNLEAFLRSLSAPIDAPAQFLNDPFEK
jgi:cytochrome c peroxidase